MFPFSAVDQVGEVGELSELFQWRGEVAPGLPTFSAEEKGRLGEELSDVLLYLVRLADRCGIDLAASAAAKVEANGVKYPADKVRGSSAKYSEYSDDAGATGGEAPS
jgi:dCTP diphosphatase